jgi:GMP synthase (glutamine-hydrolysing)
LTNFDEKNMPELLIINSAEPGTTEFVEPLRQIAEAAGKHNDTIIEYAETLTTDLTRFNGMIISGSPRGNDIVDHHLPYFQWITDCSVPVFGICAGHHVIGKLYGARLLRSVEKEVGEFDVFIDVRDQVFEGLPDRFPARQNHHDSITLPQGFTLLAHTQQCRVAMMKHGTHPIYSSQFHPEILNRQLLFNFLALL